MARGYRQICVIVSLLITVLFPACKDYSTNDILNLKFPTGGTKGLRISSPSPITVGQPFTITVTATNTAIPNGVQQDYQNQVNVTLQVGGGSIASVTAGGWYLGTQNFTVVYNNASLALNSTEVILLRVTDSTDASFTTVSNNITATSQVVFNQFKVVAPGTTFKGQQFNLTITATNSDNTTNTTYNGTVNLSTYLVAGTITPNTATGFVNGVATVSVTLSQSYNNLQIKAEDSVTATLTGLSNSFQVFFDTVSFVAFPQTATSIRTSWQYPASTTQANIYRDSGSGFQLIQTVYSPTDFYTDLGLTNGTTYTYRVVAQNTLGTIQYTAMTTAKPSGCTTPVSANISTNTNWTVAGSPYCLTANVDVNTSAALTIDAGVVVLVSPTFKLTITSGSKLVSNGTSVAPVIFTSSSISPTAGEWKGILFATGAIGSGIASDNYTGTGSYLTYTVVEYAGPGITTNESLYLDNCTVRNNLSSATNGAGISAAMSVGAQPVLKNALVLNNTFSGTALAGGGIYATRRTAIYSSKFFNNMGTSAQNQILGGALWLGADNNLLSASTFDSNAVFSYMSNHKGGAVYLAGSFNTLSGNSFTGNYVRLSNSAYAGIIYAEGNNNTITNNRFTNSTAWGNFGQGGAIALNGTGNSLTKNTFIGNTSKIYDNTNWIPIAGAVFLSTGNTVSYNHFASNTAMAGGALWTNAALATVTHNNFSSNVATNGANVFNGGTSTLDFTTNYWGGAVSGATSMGICDGSNTGGSCATSGGTITTTGAVSTAWPLCSVSPSDPDCVGANF